MSLNLENFKLPYTMDDINRISYNKMNFDTKSFADLFIAGGQYYFDNINELKEMDISESKTDDFEDWFINNGINMDNNNQSNNIAFKYDENSLKNLFKENSQLNGDSNSIINNDNSNSNNINSSNIVTVPNYLHRIPLQQKNDNNNISSNNTIPSVTLPNNNNITNIPTLIPNVDRILYENDEKDDISSSKMEDNISETKQINETMITLPNAPFDISSLFPINNNSNTNNDRILKPIEIPQNMAKKPNKNDNNNDNNNIVNMSSNHTSNHTSNKSSNKSSNQSSHSIKYDNDLILKAKKRENELNKMIDDKEIKINDLKNENNQLKRKNIELIQSKIELVNNTSNEIEKLRDDINLLQQHI